MSDLTLPQLLKQLATPEPPAPTGVETALTATLKQIKDNPHWTFYECAIPSGPFASGELRLNKAGGQALLSLQPRGELQERDLNLAQWGEVVDIDVNPHIPPEGTDAYTYNVQGVRMSFQLQHYSRRLRTVALAWDNTATAG